MTAISVGSKGSCGRRALVTQAPFQRSLHDSARDETRRPFGWTLPPRAPLINNVKGSYFTVPQLVPLMPSGSSVGHTTSIVKVMPMISANAGRKGRDPFAHVSAGKARRRTRDRAGTAEAFTSVLLERCVRISMDGKGRCLDNVFVERLWRTLKYEHVYLRVYDDLSEARASIGAYLEFYNHQRRHQALGYSTPNEFTARPAKQRSSPIIHRNARATHKLSVSPGPPGPPRRVLIT